MSPEVLHDRSPEPAQLDLTRETLVLNHLFTDSRSRKLTPARNDSHQTETLHIYYIHPSEVQMALQPGCPMLT